MGQLLCVSQLLANVQRKSKGLFPKSSNEVHNVVQSRVSGKSQIEALTVRGYGHGFITLDKHGYLSDVYLVQHLKVMYSELIYDKVLHW